MYYGKLPSFDQYLTDSFTSSAATYSAGYPLTYNPGFAQAIDVYLGGVLQRPNVDYGISSQVLTFSPAIPDGLNIFIRYLGVAGSVSTVLDNSITPIKLSNTYLTKAVGGNLDIVMSGVEAANSIYEFTGVLLGNISVVVPNNVRAFIVKNSTTGLFNLTVKTAAGTGYVAPQGFLMALYCDGVNVGPVNEVGITSAYGDNSRHLSTNEFVHNATSQLQGRNVVVNGGCEASQVNGTTLITPAVSQYQIDNWQQVLTVSSKLSFQQTSNVLNSLGATTSLTATVAAQYTPVTTDQLINEVPIEGLNFARFQYGTANAKAGSLQFKARASVAGTYGGSIQNYARTRSYPFTFVLAANTDTLVTIPNITGDTGGTWVGATNQGAAYIVFGLGVGPYFLQPAGTWFAGQADGATGQTQFVAQTVGSTLTITDVQFEVGQFCTQYERKLYSQVLAECQRYLPVFNLPGNSAIMVAQGINTTTVYGTIPMPVPTRIPVTGVIGVGTAFSVWGTPFVGIGCSNFGIYGVASNTLAELSFYVASGIGTGSATKVYASVPTQLVFTGAQI